MDKVRRYVHAQCKELLINNSELADDLEKEIFKVSRNRAIECGYDPTELSDDVNNIFLDLYMQIYVKVREYIQKHEKIGDVLLVPGASREELCPEKWSTMLTERTSEHQIHKKKGIHRCPKCKSWFTSYQQLQTASADESMRVSVVCLDCNWHWKYS